MAAPLAAAGQPTPIATSPIPGPALVQKQAVSPWTVELSAGYAFAGRAIEPKMIINSDGHQGASGEEAPKVNLITTDITGVYNLNEHHAFTLRFGYGTGSKTEFYVDSDDRFHVNLFTLMPGYRFTTALNDKFSGFVGVNLGVANESVKAKQTVQDIYSGNEAYKKTDFDRRVHTSAYGFAYSAEVGFNYAINDRFGLFVAYQFSGNTARPTRPSFYHGPYPVNGKKLDSQIYHGIRAGVSYNF